MVKAPVRRRAGFPIASPDQMKMSRAPLAQIRRGTRLEARQLGSIAGVAHIILRNGRCVLALADGWADRERKTRFGLDTICRLHGSTKALVCAAFMRLLEDGTVRLDDPVDKYVPFPNRVATKTGLRPAKKRATIRHLLTMTAGLGYTDSPLYKKTMARVRKGQVKDLKQLCEELAAAPLASEPGQRYEYSFCTDILGRVCEVAGNTTLDQFVHDRILKPLGMKDTYFEVPEQKKRRMAALYKCEVVPGTKRYKVTRWDHPESAPGIRSAGGGILSYKDAGMWGTARDYARFCQMLLDGGLAPAGISGSRERVLRAATVRMIWSDALHHVADKTGCVENWNVDDTEGPAFEGQPWSQCGWSPLSALLQLNGKRRGSGPARSGHSMGLGGGGGTYWLVDAKHNVAALSFTQSFEGGRAEDDGLGPPGNDCVDLAVAAAKEGDAAERRRLAATRGVGRGGGRALAARRTPPGRGRGRAR
ncbi:unnamed protein product [Polarella glacialis]|uniref:Beta-lactamase-related domain-containing protein n=1 Tax=Polarella glacialis TaxID=89957 RepID=A0A813LRT5_POLGL|nr:unnamed protein product [Polarella glacialis]